MSSLAADLAVVGATQAFALLEIHRVRRELTARTVMHSAVGFNDAGMVPLFRSTVTDNARNLEGAYILPIPPTEVRTAIEPSIAITRTAGGTVREYGGDRIRTISFNGEVGLDYRLGTDANGSYRYMPSKELFEELWKFLSKYLDLAARRPGSGAKPNSTYELVLRYFPRNWHYVVEPKAPFAASQDRSHRQSYRYEMNFETIQKLDIPSFGGWLGKIQTGISWLKKGSAFLSRCIEYAGVTIGLADSITKSAIGLSDQLAEPLYQIQSLVPTLQAALDDTAVLVKLPFEIGHTLWQSAQDACSIIGINISGKSGEDRRAYVSCVRPLLIAMDDLQTNAYKLGALLMTALRSQNNLGPIPYRTHRLVAGETLHSIANRELGDSSRWVEIASLNNLVTPYISSSGLPGTARPGYAILLIPDDFEQGQSGDSIGNVTPGSDEDLFGVDLWLRDGDMVPVSASGNELDDFAWRRGANNVLDALDRRYNTPYGSNDIFPGLGIANKVGERNLQDGSWFMAHVIEQTYRDNRVQEVRSPAILSLGDGFAVDMTVVLSDGRQERVLA